MSTDQTKKTLDNSVDVLLVGAGIMSATLGTMLQELDSSLSIALLERNSVAALESSNPWNNAGTGHAALCELNYAPQAADGSVATAKAVGINEQYLVSNQYWAHLLESGRMDRPEDFINKVAHMSFVWGDDHADYLQKRYDAFSRENLFAEMQHTEDPDRISEWAPLLMQSRTAGQRISASRFENGTDVDFGALTNKMLDAMENSGATIAYDREVIDLVQTSTGRWGVLVKDKRTGEESTVLAKFVFVGAGGGALPLLQKSGIPEGKGFAGFPISGQFLRCTNEEIIAQHDAKVYGQAQVGAPPMSVPHLDTRFVNGKRSLMFGPYAGFSTKFLKGGSYFDLPGSLRPDNIMPMLGVAKDNMDLTKYLVTEVLKTRASKDDSLRQFFPAADGSDWELITAGQRVQVIKKDLAGKGVLQFGTELITSADGSLGALLGASPGASTAAPIMVNLIKKALGDKIPNLESKLAALIPSYGRSLNEDASLLATVTKDTRRALKIG